MGCVIYLGFGVSSCGVVLLEVSMYIEAIKSQSTDYAISPWKAPNKGCERLNPHLFFFNAILTSFSHKDPSD